MKKFLFLVFIVAKAQTPISSVVSSLASSGFPNAGSCTNQAVTALNNGAAPTCSSISNAFLSGLIGLSHGGLNLDLTATGGTNFFLRQNSAGGQPDVVQPSCASLSNSVSTCSSLDSPVFTTKLTGTNFTLTGSAPGVSCTGLGTGSCSVAGNDNIFTVTLSPTGSPAATGTIVITWNVAAGTEGVCGFSYRNGSGGWGTGLLPLVVTTSNTTTKTFTWTQASALSASSTYLVDFICHKR